MGEASDVALGIAIHNKQHRAQVDCTWGRLPMEKPFWPPTPPWRPPRGSTSTGTESSACVGRRARPRFKIASGASWSSRLVQSGHNNLCKAPGKIQSAGSERRRCVRQNTTLGGGQLSLLMAAIKAEVAQTTILRCKHGFCPAPGGGITAAGRPSEFLCGAAAHRLTGQPTRLA